MPAIKKILSPVDFSETGTAAVRAAEELAHVTGSELVLLHVINEPAFSFPEGGYALPPIVEEYERAMKKKLAELVETVRKDVVVSGRTVHGTPHEAIVEVADREHIDLVVMGTHGRTGISHLLLGSVAERVVRTAKMPVMTVRSP